ncbi:MAG TPA: hypothetical protein VFC67_19760 [Prolixibacteraceae bacterium]|nr:hypothetical protein [Prolixibacteraceae bacterium]
MNFEAKIIKTKNWRKTPYGYISLILYAIASVVVFIIAPKHILERDYLTEWFGPYQKPFLWLNLILLLNGALVLILELRFSFKTIGNISMTDKCITINQISDSSVHNVSEIAAIRLYYYGYKSFWKSWGKGSQNFITIVDKQDIECVFEFFLCSHDHKKNLVDQLLSFQKQGIKIKLDYLNPSNAYYPNDTDFVELKLLDRYQNKQVLQTP